MVKNEAFLETLGLKPVARKVLTDIARNGSSSVADISARLAIPKSSVYDAVAILVDKSLINEYSEDSERGKKYGMSDKEQLVRAHAQRMEEFKAAHSSLLSFMDSHAKAEPAGKPKIRFYSGTLGIQQAFRDMPWTKHHTETYLMWPMQDMLDSLGEQFLRWHGEQRHQYGVMFYSIEKHGDRALQTKEHSWLENSVQKTRTNVRYMPKGTDWKMSYWIYGDKCLFASGGSEKIAFTVHSKEFCHIMKLMWQNMWEVAKK
ncbi:MAG TPA: helix-turn-helix domain-containing protein [Candidatus Paceibacterota bacterium]